MNELVQLKHPKRVENKALTLRNDALVAAAQASDSRTLRVLDLCSGLNGWTSAWRVRKHACYGVELNPKFRPEIQMDARILAKNPKLFLDTIVEPGWRPDVILASPPCEGWCVPAMGKMWEKRDDDLLVPKHPTAVYCLEVLEAVLKIIAETQPDYFWIENPVAMMRRAPQMQAFRRVTISACAYGETRQKATDLWGRWPETWEPRPFCTADPHKTGLCKIGRKGVVTPLPLGTKVRAPKGPERKVVKEKLILTYPDGREEPTNETVYVLDAEGSPCHEAAPRGAQTGTQGIKGSDNRAVIAPMLSLETCIASEKAYGPITTEPIKVEAVVARHVAG